MHIILYSGKNILPSTSAAQDGRDPDKVGCRRTDNASSRAAILKANSNLQNAVRVCEELVEMLSCPDPDQMRTQLENWVKLYSSVGISQLTRFTKTITNRMEGIVSRANFPINSGRIEGVNAFIKGMRRSAFGYQDFDYFALLIWEQTHSTSRQDAINPKKKKRSYKRSKPHNQKRLKPTVYRLSKSCHKEAG